MVKKIVAVVSVVVLAWFVLSTAEVCTKNLSGKEVSKINVYNVITHTTEEEITEGCGNPITKDTVIVTACVYSINGEEVIFETEDGELYGVWVSNPQNYTTEGYYCLFLRPAEDDDLMVIKTFVEVW